MGLRKSAGIIAAGWGQRLGQTIPKALTRVAGKPLIDHMLDGLRAAGITHVTCIVNEAARAVPEYVQQTDRDMVMDWIVKTTPSSMHSFLIVLERLAQTGESFYFMTTVDAVCPPVTFKQFADSCAQFEHPDVCLGLTRLIDDEKPLYVRMRGDEDNGSHGAHPSKNPDDYQILALTDKPRGSSHITAGFYGVNPRILEQKASAQSAAFSALRHYLAHLLQCGYRFYGVPLPDIVDLDRPEDIRRAEDLLIS